MEPSGLYLHEKLPARLVNARIKKRHHRRRCRAARQFRDASIVRSRLTRGVIVGQGDSWDEALADVRSGLRFTSRLSATPISATLAPELNAVKLPA